LESNQFDALRDDFAAAYTLGRNLAKDRVLISDLVQIAIENILTSIVMENYYLLSADQLDQLVAAMDAAPRRGTIADTIPTEHHAFFRYFLRKVEGLIGETNGHNELFWPRFAAFWNPLATENESGIGPEPSADRIQEAAGNKPAEVVRLLNEMPAFYAETTRIMALPYLEFKQQFPAYWTRITGSQNPFIKQLFTIFRNVRGKEFSAVVRLEMVRAAAAYKRGGMTALRAVPDPLVGGAFEFTRIQFEGVDRGFQLKSKEQFRDFDEVMIFLEKPGRHFRLDGKNAGTTR
ncbi:MAG TPA: hypothetical protein VK633_14700, partial [Verrucomicrobiae bacterium]|nr:hypothetical protein [Verrucomicrobiae bacterium]